MEQQKPMKENVIITEAAEKHYRIFDTTTPLNVCAYCRVSTDKADQRNSFESQRNFFNRELESHQNWKIGEIFADEDAPYGQNANRPWAADLRLFTGGFFILFSTTQIRNEQSH